MAQEEKRLSDTRGNKAGIRFFQIFLKLFGFTHTRIMVWIITFFYALFDRSARKKVLPYVKHRFPECGKIMEFYHIWAIFAAQGCTLVLQEIYRQTGGMIEVIYEDEESRKIRYSTDGFVVLYSHFGPWQASMFNIDVSQNRLNVMAQQDVNANINKMGVLHRDPRMEKITMVPAGPGSLTYLQGALNEHENVAIMGDRCHETNPVKVEFLGAPAYFPVAGFYLAARAGSPLLSMFAVWNGKSQTFKMELGTAMYPQMNGRDRNSLIPYIQQYVKKLEMLCMKYPHQCFLLENVWEEKL